MIVWANYSSLGVAKIGKTTISRARPWRPPNRGVACNPTSKKLCLFARDRLVECAPIFGALVHNAPLSALLSAQCALSAPKAPFVAPINDQVAPSFFDVLNCVSW